MADLSSDSSSDSDYEPSDSGSLSPPEPSVSLTEINDCVREYEKEQKKERKKRWDAGIKAETVIVPQADLGKYVGMTPTAVKRLQRKEASEAQKRSMEIAREARKQKLIEAKKVIDKRPDPSVAGIAIPIKKPIARKKKEPVKEESEESEEEAPAPVKKFQARKPKLDDDDLEEKVKKLDKLNQVIESNNPWLARILESRRKH